MSCFHLSNGAFGNKNGSWVLSLIGLVEGVSLVWRWVRKGVLQRTVYVRVVANGSQQLDYKI